jgi:CBS domain-containing protein
MEFQPTSVEQPSSVGIPSVSSEKLYRPRPLAPAIRRKLLREKPNTLKSTFLAEPIEDICFRNWKNKRLVLIGENSMIERALSRISTHNIHSIPVISKSGKGILGTIDVSDIINSLINFLENLSNPNLTLQQNLRRDFMNQQVSSMISKEAYVISGHSPIYDAVSNLIKFEQERLVVVDRVVEKGIEKFEKMENDVVGLITVSDILKFLVQNSMLMRKEKVFCLTLRELGIGKSIPKLVNSKTRVSEAFKMMGKLCSEGFAVVDDNGSLVGNLSASDLKGVTRTNCAILNSTVEDFLSRDLKKGWWQRPLCVDLDDTLYHCAHEFVSLGIHRMYVVDTIGRPIGEVNHRDILNQLWNAIK